SPEAVTIVRDAYGVPHLFTSGAGARERGAYGNGYAQAEDRLFEMDILRRGATGRLAEMLGPDFLLMDEVVRRDGLTPQELGRPPRCARNRAGRAGSASGATQATRSWSGPGSRRAGTRCCWADRRPASTCRASSGRSGCTAAATTPRA